MVSSSIIRKMNAIDGNLRKNKVNHKLTQEEKWLTYSLHFEHKYSINAIRLYLLKEKKITISNNSLRIIAQKFKKKVEKHESEKTGIPPKNENSADLFGKSAKKQQKSTSEKQPEKTAKKTKVSADLENPKNSTKSEIDEKNVFEIYPYKLNEEDLDRAKNDVETVKTLDLDKRGKLIHLAKISEQIFENSNLPDATYHWNDLYNEILEMMQKMRREN